MFYGIAKPKYNVGTYRTTATGACITQDSKLYGLYVNNDTENSIAKHDIKHEQQHFASGPLPEFYRRRGLGKRMRKRRG